MKKCILIVSAILLLMATGLAYAGAFNGHIAAINDTKNSLVVKSDVDKKEYRFECDKGVIPPDVQIGNWVRVTFIEEDNIKKATKVFRIIVD
jgi:hypothetical protein